MEIDWYRCRDEGSSLSNGIHRNKSIVVGCGASSFHDHHRENRLKAVYRRTTIARVCYEYLCREKYLSNLVSSLFEYCYSYKTYPLRIKLKNFFKISTT